MSECMCGVCVCVCVWCVCVCVCGVCVCVCARTHTHTVMRKAGHYQKATLNTSAFHGYLTTDYNKPLFCS